MHDTLWFLVSCHGVNQPETVIHAWHFVVPGHFSRCKATSNIHPCMTLCVPGHFSRCKATSNIHPCMTLCVPGHFSRCKATSNINPCRTLCVPGHFSRCKATSNINPCVTRLRSKHEHESARMPNVTARLVVWMYIYETSNTWTERQLNGDMNCLLLCVISETHASYKTMQKRHSSVISQYGKREGGGVCKRSTDNLGRSRLASIPTSVFRNFWILDLSALL